MTALDFILKPEQILIAMDSLAIDEQTKKPAKFTSKIFYIPHLHGAICGTGDFDVILDWHAFIMKNVIAHTIRLLDKIAPAELSRIHKGLERNTTATIYHFGYIEQEKIFEGYVYRSTNQYQSEKLSIGIGIKPYGEEVQQSIESHSKFSSEDDLIIRIMNEQRRLDNKATIDERVGIGGEVHVLQLNASGALMYICHRWDDYGAMLQEILDSIKEQRPISLEKAKI